MERPYQPYFKGYWDDKICKKCITNQHFENAIFGASRATFQILLLCIIRKTLDKLQNRASHILTNNAYNVSAGPLLRQLKLPSISDMINAEAPLYLTEQFTRASTIASRTLRGSNFSLRPRSFAYRGSSVWNSLANDIKSTWTFGSFQKKLKAMLAEKS